MPTYEYRCNECGHGFEKFQNIKDEPVRRCPECGGESAERVISAGAGLIFRGPGFYATDYGGSSGGGEGQREGGAPPGSDSGDDGDDGGAERSDD